MKLKGIALPVETIVIVAIVILVLVVIGAMFILNIGKSTSAISDDAARGNGCNMLALVKNCAIGTSTKDSVLNDIKISGYDIDNDGTPNSLLDACKRKGFATADDCWKSCGCPEPSVSAGGAADRSGDVTSSNKETATALAEFSNFMADISTGAQPDNVQESNLQDVVFDDSEFGIDAV